MLAFLCYASIEKSLQYGILIDTNRYVVDRFGRTVLTGFSMSAKFHIPSLVRLLCWVMSPKKNSVFSFEIRHYLVRLTDERHYNKHALAGEIFRLHMS